MEPKNPLLQAQHVSNLLDQYDESFDLYRSYNERLLLNLGEVFNKTTLPVSAIAGDLMSRPALKKMLVEKGGYYTRLRDIENLITVRVVVYFSDDIDLAINLIGKEFALDDCCLPLHETPDHERFGINIRRFDIKLLPEQYARPEYQRYATLKAELEIRTVLQHSWSEVKGIFDVLMGRSRLPGQNVNKLAQISYLLKMADEELVRIKDQIMHQNMAMGTAPGGGVVMPPVAAPVEYAAPANPSHAPVVPAATVEPASQEPKPVDPQKQAAFATRLEAFILNEALIRDIDRSIADHYETRLVYRENFVSSLSEVFLRLGFDREERLLEELTAHKNVILIMMKNIFGDTSKAAVEYIHKGSALLVLYYVLLAKTGNVDIIKKNVRNYISLKGISVEEFANDLLAYYKKTVRRAPDPAW
ncbi:MAG: hypothetical protein G8237_02930 [Magnetococcales bacterium]|nr:hypothetical protein [Magnetococcales bacterium]NGZ05288.1 hypothetical protein [Magnetococcales bacterium]